MRNFPYITRERGAVTNARLVLRPWTSPVEVLLAGAIVRCWRKVSVLRYLGRWALSDTSGKVTRRRCRHGSNWRRGKVRALLEIRWIVLLEIASDRRLWCELGAIARRCWSAGQIIDVHAASSQM